jgi:hypothetical protein
MQLGFAPLQKLQRSNHGIHICLAKDDYGGILQISQHACTQVIKAAHKALVLMRHPDKKRGLAQRAKGVSDSEYQQNAPRSFYEQR